MAYIKKDPLEVSRARSEASRKRKHYGGGRPKGYTKDTGIPTLQEDPLTSISIRTSSKAILDRYAAKKDLTRVEAVRRLMLQIEAQLNAIENIDRGENK